MAEPASACVPALDAVLDGIGPAAVAVSGGVDSMTLALLAGRRLGGASAMFHAVSPAVPPEATARVRAVAAREGWRLTVLDAGEFDDPAYRANPADRCFHCKTNLYGALAAHTAHSGATLLSGTNLDDLGDWRPGLKAAEAHGVRHPFVEAGIGKDRIRAIAAGLGFHDLARLPAAPCLASRIETGLRVEADDLAAVHAAERYIARQLRPETVRCRRRRAGIVIELDAPTLGALGEGRRAQLGSAVAGMFGPGGGDGGDRARPVRFAPYRAGSAFLRPVPPA